MQSVEHCIGRASYLIGSGPAAAPSAGIYLGSLKERKDLITVDMGGTSFDVCLIQGGNIPTTTERWEGEHRLAVKSVDVHSVGAGGGSIAWIDALGLLRVGPRSAGAEPGPCCYGRGNGHRRMRIWCWAMCRRLLPGGGKAQRATGAAAVKRSVLP
jgi:N-methylhydantoinase A